MEVQERKSFLGRPLVHVVLIAVLGLIIYSNTFDASFHLDSIDLIADNPMVRDFGYFLNPSEKPETGFFAYSNNRYFDYLMKGRSVGYLTFALNYSLNGLDVTGYHVFNTALHVLNALLVYHLFLLILKTPYFIKAARRDHARYGALLAALIFLAHPVQTGAVTYIYQRFASLAAFFYLLSLASYAHARLSPGRTGRVLLYVLSVTSAVFAMKTKENAFTLPVAVMLFEFVFLECPRRKRFLYLLPLLLTIVVVPLGVIDFDKPIDEALDEAMRTQHEISRYEYFVTQSRVIVTYVRLLLLPVNQNLDYDYPLYSSIVNPAVLLSLVCFLGIVFLIVYLFRRLARNNPSSRIAVFALLFFLVTLSVESSLIALEDVIFEHRLYLPLVGYSFALAALFLFALKNRIAPKKVVSVALLLITALSVISYARNDVWKTELTLWSDVVKKSPRKPRALNNLGLAYQKSGNITEAIAQYQSALQFDPGADKAHNNLGNAYSSLGEFDRAVEHYIAALEQKPFSVEYLNNLGVAYFQKGMTDKAIELYRFALKQNPGADRVHHNLGNAFFRKGMLDDAIREYEIALSLNPSNLDARRNLNRVMAMKAGKD